MKAKTMENTVSLGMLAIVAASLTFSFLAATGRIDVQPQRRAMHEVVGRAALALGFSQFGRQTLDETAGSGQSLDNPFEPSDSGAWAVAKNGETVPIELRAQKDGDAPILPKIDTSFTAPAGQPVAFSLHLKGESDSLAIEKLAIMGADGSWIAEGGEGEFQIESLKIQLRAKETKTLLIYLKGLGRPVVARIEGSEAPADRNYGALQVEISGPASESQPAGSKWTDGSRPSVQPEKGAPLKMT